VPSHTHNKSDALGRRTHSIVSSVRSCGCLPGAARHDAAFAREPPRFLAAIWRVLNEYELAGYVDSQKPALRRQLRALLYMS